MDLPITIQPGRTREDHISDHEQLHRHNNSVIYSADFNSLNDAIQAAINNHRPVILAPKVHTLTEPIVITNAVNFALSAYGAELRAGANMDVLFDVVGGGYNSFRGLNLTTAEGVTVGDMLRVRSGAGWAHNNSFYDTWIQGSYTTGIRIGAVADASNQCDDTLFVRTELNSAHAGSIGVHAGNGLHANNLLHKFYALTCSGHSTHFRVDATSVHIDGANFDRAELDFDIGATRCYAAHVRSEESTQFVKSRGPGTYGAQAAFVNCQWYGENSILSGRWIEWYQAGSLRLQDCTVLGSPMQPVVYASPSASLHIIVDGLMCGAAVSVPHATAISVNNKTTVTTRSYTELDITGAVVAQVIA